MKVFPVIHYLNRQVALEQADLAFDAGADGIFLISHNGDDTVLTFVAQDIKKKHPKKAIGLNFLSKNILLAGNAARAHGLDMIWGDNCGISSEGVTPMGEMLKIFSRNNPKIKIFASVAFKYQAPELNPALAAKNAYDSGFIPTTSGEATGQAPTVEKIRIMSQEVNGKLAVASGMTCENVEQYRQYLSHILVATGVSQDDHHFDYEKLYRFIALARKRT